MGLHLRIPATVVFWLSVACPAVISQHSLLPGLRPHTADTYRLDGSAGERVGVRHARSFHRPNTAGSGPRRFLTAGAVAPDALTAVRKYSSAVLECEFQGSPPPSIDWFKDGRPHQKSSLAESLEEQSNSLDSLLTEPSVAIVATQSRLYFDCVTPQHQGVYSCRAHNGIETADLSTSLFVEDGADEEERALCERVKNLQFRPVRVIQWRSKVFAMMGTSIRLVCETTGFPRPVITWTKNGQPLTENDPRVTVLPSGDLRIEHLVWSDMGLYRCTATNELTADSVTSFLYPFLP